jgi:hypothetical protein
MRIPTLLSLLALALPPTGALTSTSCYPIVCTAAFYQSGLAVRVMIPSTPASYRIEVEAEGDVLSLAYEVLAETELRCTSSCQPVGDRIELEEGFSSLEQIVVFVRRRGEDRGPDEVRVRVYRADTLVVEGFFEPRYQVDEPNGRGCGERVLASATLDAR